jgi:hypothetical protein
MTKIQALVRTFFIFCPRMRESETMYRKLFILAFCLVAGVCRAASPSALKPDFILDGLAGPELSAAWWQWAMSAPEDKSPIEDMSGVNCAVNQSGQVWFLAGGYGSSRISRTCTVPAGKYLFFPLVNMAYWSTGENDGFTCQDAKARAALNNDTALDLFVSIDGVTMEGANRFRYRTEKCFDIFARIPKAMKPYDAFPSASDGYWIALPPLPKGKHVLNFGGRYNRNSPAFGRMVQDIRYEIEIK